jgi:ubiquinone/menaquinone biosynthesis C-methylase UbiE
MNNISGEKVYKIINKSYNDIINLSLLHKVFLFFLIIIFILLLNKCNINYENYEDYEDMTSGSRFESKYDDAIYDSFYAKYYDDLHSNKECNVEQLKIIVSFAKNIKFVKLLDIGCGTGYHVYMLDKMKYDVIGLDKSADMIKQAKLKYMNCEFIVADFLKNNLFDYNSFTHLICLNKTFYSFKDKELFFEKSNFLLNADGLLIIHIVNREKFKPFVVSQNDKTVLYNSENENEKKIPQISIVKINDSLEYISEYEVLDNKNRTNTSTNTSTNSSTNSDENIILNNTINSIDNTEMLPFSCYNEKFTNLQTNAVRKHVINLYIPNIDEIIVIAKAKGFSVKDKKPLQTCGTNTEFLLILKKTL